VDRPDVASGSEILTLLWRGIIHALASTFLRSDRAIEPRRRASLQASGLRATCGRDARLGDRATVSENATSRDFEQLDHKLDCRGVSWFADRVLFRHFVISSLTE
jgi:hypothetical protein